ncbi:MAG TPA: hypothetical protein EYH00_05045 [Archaeoglobus profundus]|nr:hypothetical protein [Archaeoglobus profundus]
MREEIKITILRLYIPALTISTFFTGFLAFSYLFNIKIAIISAIIFTAMIYILTRSMKIENLLMK